MFLHLFLDAAIMEIERNTMLHKFIFSVHGVLTRAEPKAGPYDPRCEFIRKRRISYQKFQCANCGDIFIQEDENYPRIILKCPPLSRTNISQNGVYSAWTRVSIYLRTHWTQSKYFSEN